MPELVVENPLDERVLLYDGEELVGAKQNRILNVSVLVEAKSTLTIPVSCVEQGRWSRDVAGVRGRPPHLARASSAGARRRRRPPSRSRAASRRARSGTRCTSRLVRMSVDSPTGASSRPLPRLRARTSVRSRTRSRRSRASAAPSSGSATTLPRRRLAAGRVRAAVAEAPRRLPARRARAARRQADAARGRADASSTRSARAEQARQPSAGLGEDVRLRGERVIGSGLELEGELIQLSAFTSEDGGRRAFGRIARPSRRG